MIPNLTEPDDAPASRPIQRAKAANTKAAILDAAAVVVERDGVAALTLERVADEAGVSKGGLLYHFANKADLVVAMLNRTLDRADDRLAELADAHDGAPGAFAHAYLDYVSGGDHARDAGAVGVFAAAASDDGDLGPAQQRFAEWQDRLLHHDGLDETTALTARIVGDGLWLIDLFGLAPPSEEQRRLVVEELRRRIEQRP